MIDGNDDKHLINKINNIRNWNLKNIVVIETIGIDKQTNKQQQRRRRRQPQLQQNRYQINDIDEENSNRSKFNKDLRIA